MNWTAVCEVSLICKNEPLQYTHIKEIFSQHQKQNADGGLQSMAISYLGAERSDTADPGGDAEIFAPTLCTIENPRPGLADKSWGSF